MQQDPSSPGSSAIVTSAEELTKQVSQKLLTDENTTGGISVKAEGVGVWLDITSSTADFKSNSLKINQRWTSNSTPRTKEQNDDLRSYRFPTENTRISSNNNPEDDQSIFDDVIVLPKAAFGTRSVVTNVRYKNLKQAMPTRYSDDSDVPSGAEVRENRMNSAVLTTSIFPRPPHHVFTDDPVSITFKHDRTPQSNQNAPGNTSSPSNITSNSKNLTLLDGTSEENVYCVYWKVGESDDDGGSWSTEGCSLVDFNKTHTTCNCTHLTSFALLLQIVDYNVDDEESNLNQKVLSVISKVGCVLSLLGVGVMCAAFIKLRFHTENMKIHFNLGVAVGLADLTFLFHEIATGSKSSCAVITILLYYFNMAVLSWMLVEGFHLYSQVVVVFVSVRRRFKYYAAAGWGFPLFALTVTSAILNNRLGSYKSCWLSPLDNSIWAFAAPAVVVVVINSFVLLSVVRIIVRIEPGKSNHLKAPKLRNAVKGSIFLFPLLGTTWIFGFFAVNKETMVFQYLFAITNSLQGFFLFIFHCLCNSEVREDARRHKWFGSSDSTIWSSNPHILSHPPSLNVASRLRRIRNSISFETPSSFSTGSEDPNDSYVKQTKTPKKINTLFTRMLPLKLPATIAEKEEKYESVKSSTKENNVFQFPNEEKQLTLPGMPIKNDTINLEKFKHQFSGESQITLDQWLINQMVQNALREMFKEITPAEEELIKQTLFGDDCTDEKQDNEKKMKMSYDSGLNSIDNESILDEGEEDWADKEKKISTPLKESVKLSPPDEISTK